MAAVGPGAGGSAQSDWARALAWRASRQFLDPLGEHGEGGAARTVEQVVGRLVALPASTGDAGLAIGRRRGRPSGDALAESLRLGAVVATYTFRGAVHLMTPEVAVDHLVLRAAGRQWELASWQQHYELAPGDWPALRDAVRGALEARPLTRGELAAAIERVPRFAHLSAPISSGNDTLLKPFFWLGDVAFGPTRDRQSTLRSLADDPRWPARPDLDDAGPRAVLAYLAAYGPAAPDRIRYWLGEGLSAGGRRLTGWVDDLRASGRVAEIALDGEPVLVADEHVVELERAEATDAVALLPGYDQWVLGPGTADPRTVPAEHRAAFTRGAAPIVSAGRIVGTWRARRGVLELAGLDGSTSVPNEALHAEIERIAVLLGRSEPMRVDVTSL